MRNLARGFPRDANTAGLWQLDGHLKDESNNGLDLQMRQGTEKYGAGASPDRRAEFFDGASIAGRPSGDATLKIAGDVTIETVFQLYATPSLANLIDCTGPDANSASNSQYGIGIDSDRTLWWNHQYGSRTNQFYQWNVATVGADAAVIPLHEWVYLAVVRDDTAKTVTPYVNGVPLPAYSYTTSATDGANSFFEIGGLFDLSIQYLSGVVGSTRVSSVKRTPAEIAANTELVLADRAGNMATPALLPEVTPVDHASLTLWHRADDNTTDDKDTVTTPALLGGANGMTQATLGSRPFVATAAGKESWRMWDGAALRYFAGGTSTLYIANTPRYHVYTVFMLEDATLNDGNPALNHRLLGTSPRYWGVYARRLGGTTVQIYGYHYDSSAKITPHEVSLGEVHLLEMWFDVGAGETVSRLDDGPEVRAAVAGIGGSGTMQLGNSNAVFPGHVHEAVLANDEDADTRIGIRNYFRNRYLIDV